MRAVRVPLLLAIALGACAIGVIASVVFTWASGKSALWNIGFAVAAVLATALIVLGALWLVPRF